MLREIYKMKKVAWIFVYLINFFTYSSGDNVTEYVRFEEGITTT